MKNTSLFFLILVLFSCSSDKLNRLPIEHKSNEHSQSKYLNLFGNKDSILKILEDEDKFDRIRQLILVDDIKDENRLISSCTFNENDELVVVGDRHLNSNEYQNRTFRTLFADEFISSGNDDVNAITRLQVFEECLTIIYAGLFPIVIPYYVNVDPQISYINIRYETPDAEAYWGAATEMAINRWNKAINDNDFNNHLDGSPLIYFRIAPYNFSDYGNIEIRRVDNSEMTNSGAFAEASTGYYNELSNQSGVYKHSIGSFIRVNNSLDSNMSVAGRFGVLCHEIGHTIGFLHSGSQAANIEGTTQNYNSVFNRADAVFWNEDLIAIDRIFNVPVEIIECTQ